MTELDHLDAQLEQLKPEDLQRCLQIFHENLCGAEVSYLQTCVHCGLCAESCHYYRADGELESIPAYKLQQISSIYKRHFTTIGKLGPHLVGAKTFDRSMAGKWVESCFGRCSLCGRCSLNCTTGIHVSAVIAAARAALTEMNLLPSDLLSVVTMSLETGNNMGIEKNDWLETVRWIEEELQLAVKDEEARIPVDKQGARILFTVNPREPKFFPLTLLASATVLHAAREDWTVSSEGWDLTNYGLFTASPKQGGAITQNLKESMTRLGCKVLVIGECGHGFAAARWEAPQWLRMGYDFEVKSFLEVMEGYFRDGRIKVDPKRHPDPVTLHDPCNLVRIGGVSEPQRAILRRTVSDFVEMTPNRADNFCCAGGGGQLSMSRYKSKRLQAGSVKAEQIRRTGAKTVVAPCHNCIDQLMELNKEYKLGVTIKTVAEMVADAIVLPSLIMSREESYES
jgi:Fe-S oxidoreductase